MRKYILAIFLLIILAGASFTGGAFFAEKKIGGTTQKAISNENTESSKDLNNAEPADIVEVSEGQKNNSKEPTEEPVEIPVEENKFSFAILGDTQYFKPGSNGGFQKAASNIKKINPDLVFAVGDLVSSCGGGADCESKLNSWKNTLGPLGSKAYVMQGNHDRTGEDKADAVWQRVFSYLPANGPAGFAKFAYSFDYKNSHFVVLDSDKPKENDINSVQLDWLEKDLSANRKDYNFVFFHEPAYPTNSKIGESLDESPKDRDRLWNILVNNKITAVFSGHEHIQSRRKVNGIYQFGFGNTDSFNHDAPKPGTAEYFYIGQAFGMVEINSDAITVKTYSADGKLLNSFELKK
ncbi:MAG: metallophosphoesterase [Patescibacteria group bacterium]